MTTGNNVLNLLPMLQRRNPAVHRTPERKREAERLNERYKELKKTEGLTQKELGKLMRVKQAMVSHYLTGRKPISSFTLLRFCKHLRLAPLAVRPDFDFADLCPGTLPPDVIRDARAIAQLDPSIRKGLREIIHARASPNGDKSEPS